MHIDDLLELEHRGWRSLCEGSGADFYGALMTDDGVMVLANGSVLDRATVVASLREAPPWRDYAICDPRLIELGEGSASLVYTGRAYREEGAPPFEAVMSSTYRQVAGAWKLALYQQTPRDSPSSASRS